MKNVELDLLGMKEFHEFNRYDTSPDLTWVRKNPQDALVLLLNAEELMLEATRIMGTARAGQTANEIAFVMNNWIDLWNKDK